MLQAEQDALVLLAQQGDREAFTLLYRALTPELLRFSYRLCDDRQLAADLVQDIWVGTFKSIHRLDDPRVLRSWLYRATRWRTLDAMRNSDRLRPLKQVDEWATDSNDEIEAPESVLNLIKALHQDEQHTVYLFYASELKLDEIALVLEVPVGTVKSRLNRARKKLKELWESKYES